MSRKSYLPVFIRDPVLRSLNSFLSDTSVDYDELKKKSYDNIPLNRKRVYSIGIVQDYYKLNEKLSDRVAKLTGVLKYFNLKYKFENIARSNFKPEAFDLSIVHIEDISHQLRHGLQLTTQFFHSDDLSNLDLQYIPFMTVPDLVAVASELKNIAANKNKLYFRNSWLDQGF